MEKHTPAKFLNYQCLNNLMIYFVLGKLVLSHNVTENIKLDSF